DARPLRRGDPDRPPVELKADSRLPALLIVPRGGRASVRPLAECAQAEHTERKSMKIADISTLLRTLDENSWYATDPDEWSALLEDLHEGHAQGDLDALIVFLDFAADSFGAQHDWATKEFREFFEQAYRA